MPFSIGWKRFCIVGGTSFYTNDGDQGWTGFALALALLTVARKCDRQAAWMYNYGPWENTQFEFFGFGAADTSALMMWASGVRSSIWGPTAAMLADALGVTLDNIDEAHSVIYAHEDFEIASGQFQREQFRIVVRAKRDG